MRQVRFAYERLSKVCVLIACIATIASPSRASDNLQGIGQWDPDVIQQYFKHSTYPGLDISPGPGNYANRQMLTGLPQTCHNDDGTKYTVTSQVNAEFAKRVDVLMAVFRAAGGKNVGIVPCTGALRSAKSQIDLYKQCRRPPPGGTQASAGSTWVDDLRGPGNQLTTDPKVGHFVKSASCPEGSPVTWQAVSWHNVGLAVDFGQFKASGKYDNGGAFLYDIAFRFKVYGAMDSLGMLSGDSFGDPAHVDWHPYLLNPADAGASGTAATNVKAGYAWKFPSTIYFWSPKLGNGAAGRLVVYDFGTDGNWITVKAKRSIEGYGNADWSGTWVTYNPAVKVFPAYIPTVSLENFEHRYHSTSSVEIKSYQTTAGREDWRDVKGSLDYYPYFNVGDLQKEANVVIGKARSLRAKSCGETINRFLGGCGTQAYKNAIRPYLTTNKNSYYNVSLFGTALTAMLPPATVKAHSDWHRPNPPTNSERQENEQLGAITNGGIGWNRDTGEVGQLIEGRGLNSDRSLKHTNLDLEIIDSKLPPGAADKTQPPSWPF